MATYTVRLSDQPPRSPSVKVEAEAVRVGETAIVFYETAPPETLTPSHVVAVFQVAHVVSVIRERSSAGVATTPPPALSVGARPRPIPGRSEVFSAEPPALQAPDLPRPR